MDFVDFIADLGLFTLKLAIAVFGVIMIVGIIADAARGQSGGPLGRLDAKRLDHRWREHARALLRASDRKQALKDLDKAEKDEKERAKKAPRPRVFVFRFDGNVQASGVDRLAEQVNALLRVAGDADEIVVRLKSPGGLVYSYGHAASQLERLRAAGLKLTICVDEVAASGGYLMAAVGHRILAAPFAIIGSIGVVAQIPNIHRFLKRRDIDVELHTAGRFKRTLTVLGENTEEGREKFKADLTRTHALFQRAIARYRPGLDLDKVATGEHWYGQEALELGLVDGVMTSDAYLVERSAEAEIIALGFAGRKGLVDRVARELSAGVGRGLGVAARRVLGRNARVTRGAGDDTLLM
jgi:serine protease SohB